MGIPAQIGKQQYNEALRVGRQTNTNMRRILRRMMEEAQSPLIKALIGQAAMELSDNDAVLNQLDEIGKTLRQKKASLNT